MDLGLKGKRVLITGGTRSIGRAIVDAFVAEGAVVGFCARDAKLVKQRETEWRAKQARVHGTALDVTDDPALKNWIDGFAAEGEGRVCGRCHAAILPRMRAPGEYGDHINERGNRHGRSPLHPG